MVEGRGAHLRDPDAISAASFATIRREAPIERLPADFQALALRLIHSCGMPDILADLAWSADAVASGREALAAGAPILVDATMVAAGIRRERLPGANPIVCTLAEAQARAAALGTTRSAAAVDLWGERLAGAVVAIGNAPTALFHLLEMVLDGGPRPAAIVGCPVGFIGAAESKQALVDLHAEHGIEIPYATVRGRRGGSAMTSSALNALAQEAE